MSIMLKSLKDDLRATANPQRAQVSQRFFKTGKGQYGEGDVFLGLTVPAIRKLAKEYHALKEKDLLTLLHSRIHEERLLALIILVQQFQKGDEAKQKEIFDLYLRETASINNWDLVDSSAQYIVGAHLFGKSIKTQMELAKSPSLWERRIAMISTFYDIYQHDSTKSLKIAAILLKDKHDLIQKAVGWMLREVGKRVAKQDLIDFLDKYAHIMPRTMLRYAIERLSPQEKSHYLQMGK